MKKILTILAAVTLGVFYLTSCYNNKYDLVSLPQVSFVKDVVPIMTSGPCGCHNTISRARSGWMQFTDTATGKPNYDLIFAYSNTLRQWAKDSATHPAGGSVAFSERDKEVIKAWAAQGSINDYTPDAVTGPITYTNNILPSVVNVICNACHSKSAPTLSYALLSSSSGTTILTNMANSGGNSGHPKGTVSLSASTSKLILDWIAQGSKQ